MALRENFEIEQTIKVASADRQGKTDHLAVVDRKILEVQASKSADVADYNQTLKDLRAEQKALLDIIENGVQTVKVRVSERLNDKLQQVETVRVDTGEVIPELTRPLNQEERQLSIEDLDPQGTGKPAAGAKKAPAKAKARGGKGGRSRSAGASAE